MVDFTLDEQQRTHASWVRGLMDRHVRPAVLELDRLRDPDERFPWAILENLHAEGLLRFGLPEAFGGTPVDEITQCLIMEEFGAADIGVGGLVAQYWNVISLIDRMGNDYHRDTFIRPHLDNPRAVYSLAMTEPPGVL